jgi:hypothetical protein
VHTPFYLSVIALGFNSFNYIDISRLTIRGLIYSQAILSGSNVANSITKYQKEIDNTTPKEFGRNMIMSLAPCFTTFAFTHYLINSSVLTVSMLNFSLVGIISSQAFNLYITRKLGDDSRINYITFIINMIFILIFYIFVIQKIKAGINPFKRLNDEYRMEDLLDIENIKEDDMKLLDEENAFFFENLTEEEFQKVAEIFNKEN